MKQTNNAIKFLMAQYRAIFQNAYFKGLATAAVLTAGLAVGQAQAAASLDNLASGEATWGGTSGDTVEIGQDKDWNATLTVGASGAELKATAAATASGTGSLIINAGSGKAFTANAASGDLTINIASIQVNSGGLTLTNSDSGAATVVANDITIGDSTGDADAIVTIGAASVADKNAVLGNADSQITLNSDAKFVFQGSGSTNAELNGELVSANGALLDFTSGSGTLKVKGTAEKLNINVADKKVASISLAEQTDVLSIKAGKIDLQNSGAAFTLAKGTLDLGSEVVLTNTTSGGGTFTVNSDATLQANSSVIKSFVIEDNGDKAGKFALSGTWSLTGENNDLAGISITSADGALIKGTNVAVSDAISGASGATIQADTLTLGKADAASKALLDSGSATAKDLVLLSSGDFNLADNITLTAVSGDADAKVAENVTLEEKIVLGTDKKGLTINGGNYTAADVKVGSGSVTVTNHKDDVASTLTIGKLVLDNSAKGSSGSLTVKGATAADLEKVVLDLSNTDISYEKTSGASGTVALNADQATIKIGGKQIKTLLADSQLSGAIFDVKSGGQLLVADDLELGAAQLDSSNVTNNGIKLTKGTLNVDGTLTLSAAATVDLKKDADTAILKAKTLDLQVATPASEASTLQSGSFVVSEVLKTNSQVGVVVGAKEL